MNRILNRSTRNVLAQTLATAMAVVCLHAEAAPIGPDKADRILINGEVLTMDPAKPLARALAIKGNQIMAVGSDAEVRRFRGTHTDVVDLAGRTVIPGIVDTHMHGIRAGQEYTFATAWYRDTTIAEAIGRLRQAAAQRGPGKWVAVAGAWAPEQFVEKRAPTVDELTHALPDNPAYVEYLYDYALVNKKAIEVLGLNTGGALPPGIVVERDAQGNATGNLLGGIGPFSAMIDRINQSTPDEKKQSLVAFFNELNAEGVTGIVDPAAGGFATYSPLFSLWKDKALTLRVAYRASALPSDSESAWFSTSLTFLPPLFGDDMLRFLGVGEVLVFGMNDATRVSPGFNPSQKSRDELFKVATLAAQRGYSLEIHAYTNDAASAILDVFEKVNEKNPIANLRWVIAHITTGTEATFERMRKLGLGYTVQMGPYFEGPAWLAANGDAAARAAPPTRLALDKGLVVAGGTDLNRVGVINVWQAIEYHVTGKSAGGAVQRRADYLLSREEALRLYTANAAWITFDEARRGTLSPGKLADIAVMDAPYLRVPADQIHSLRSVMTIVDGKVVHADKDFLRKQRSPHARSADVPRAVIDAFASMQRSEEEFESGRSANTHQQR